MDHSIAIPDTAMYTPRVSNVSRQSDDSPYGGGSTPAHFAVYNASLDYFMAMLNLLMQRVTTNMMRSRLAEATSAARRENEALEAHEARAARLAHEARVAQQADAQRTARNTLLEGSLMPDAVTALAAPTATAPAVTTAARSTSLDALDGGFDPKQITFVPIRSTAEARRRDALIQDEHDFAAAVDEAAARYGIPPELLRSQIQAETWGFGNPWSPTQYLEGMRHLGDKDRGDNASRGLLQVSGAFLDGGEWSGHGPNNPRVGGRSVSRADYDSSITLQLDVGAANLAQRIVDGGGLREGLASYFSGSFDTSRATAYLQKIDNGLRDAYAQGL